MDILVLVLWTFPMKNILVYQCIKKLTILTTYLITNFKWKKYFLKTISLDLSDDIIILFCIANS